MYRLSQDPTKYYQDPITTIGKWLSPVYVILLVVGAAQLGASFDVSTTFERSTSHTSGMMWGVVLTFSGVLACISYAINNVRSRYQLEAGAALGLAVGILMYLTVLILDRGTIAGAVANIAYGSSLIYILIHRVYQINARFRAVKGNE